MTYQASIAEAARIAPRDRFLSAARTLRITLVLSEGRDTDAKRMAAWLDFARVLTVRLTDRERALVAYWCLRTLSAEARETIAYSAWMGGDA